MELRWLKDFLALAETAHFSRAAEKRNISQPAFSRRIRMLEAWVGTPLFNRDTHRIKLTPAGEQWHSTAEDVLRRVYLGREQAREVALSDSSTLRFASTHALSLTFFPAWLAAVEARTQLGASVSLVTDNMVGCAQQMLQGQAQFLLCHHHPTMPVSFNPDHFMSINIGSDTLTPVCILGPDAKGPLYVLPGSTSAPLPHLAYSENSGLGRILAMHRALNGPQAWLTPAFTAHIAIVLAAMARAGRGIAWLPTSLIEQDLAAGALVEAGGSQWNVAMEIRLYRPRARQAPAAEAFWRNIKGMGASVPVEGEWRSSGSLQDAEK